MSFLIKRRPLFSLITRYIVSKRCITERLFSNVLDNEPIFGAKLLTPKYINYESCRWKGGKGIRSPKKEKVVEDEEESDTEYDFDDLVVDKTTKVKSLKVGSLRCDGLLKAGLNIARNKVDEAFFESKIRVNGKKIYKKSDYAKEGDELDVIKGFSITNTKLLNVGRVEILLVKPRGDHFLVKMRTSKGLVIENYEEPWNSPVSKPDEGQGT